jgi:3-oxoadipate enol-lactonase
VTTPRLGYDFNGPADAPVLILGPSLGTTRSVWDPQLPLLAGRFRVLRYDHLGHGESDVPPGPYIISELADALAELMAAVRVDRAHVAGLSLGGMVGMQLAADHPQLVDQLAIVCSSAHLPPAQSWHDRAAAVRTKGSTAAIADTVVGRWFTPAFASTPAAQAARANLLETPPEGYAGCCEAIAAMDLRPLLHSIKAPTLAVTGAEDPATPAEHAETVAAGVRSGGTPARVEIVPGAAHLASVERPQEVGRLLLDHFTSS